MPCVILRDKDGNHEGFMCGGEIPRYEICQICGGLSEYLCDYPVDGKTCDLPLCERCRKNIGPELDLCPVHFEKFKSERPKEELEWWGKK